MKLPAQEIDQKLDQALRQLSATVRLPGFRPGKVPMPLLKKRYGTSVMGEILEQAVQDSSSRGACRARLAAATMPKIEITAFGEGTDLEYTLALELLPDISRSISPRSISSASRPRSPTRRSPRASSASASAPSAPSRSRRRVRRPMATRS
ncbi:MAG: trigger factor family protein [Pseudomonadota bacterium]